jgi:hypothetical protein
VSDNGDRQYGVVIREMADIGRRVEHLDKQVKRRTWVDVGGMLTLAGLAFGMGQCALSDRDETRAVAYSARNDAKIARDTAEQHGEHPSHERVGEVREDVREIKATLIHLDSSMAQQREDMAELRRILIRRARASR